MAAPEFATLTTDDLVTGEAVALDLPPASLGVRLASGLVDVLVDRSHCCWSVIFTFLLAALRADGALAQVAFVGTLVVVFLVYPTTVETLSRGKSLGKWAFGLRAVRDDAGPISFHHAFVRALVGFVEIYLFLRRAGVLLDAAELARQAPRRLRRRHLRRPRAHPAPARAAAADAAGARRLGAGGRRRRAADGARARRPPVPGPPARSRPGLTRVGGRHARPAGRVVRRPAAAPRAPRPRRSSRPSSPPVASATRPGSAASARSASG